VVSELQAFIDPAIVP